MKYIVSVNTYGITHRHFGEFSTLGAAEKAINNALKGNIILTKSLQFVCTGLPEDKKIYIFKPKYSEITNAVMAGYFVSITDSELKHVIHWMSENTYLETLTRNNFDPELDYPELLDDELAEIKRDFDIQDILDDLQTHELLDIKNYAELMLSVKVNDSFVTPKEKEDIEMTLIYSIKNATKTADAKIMKYFDKLAECPDSNKKGV